MNKKNIFQGILLASALLFYFISSPGGLEKVQSWMPFVSSSRPGVATVPVAEAKPIVANSTSTKPAETDPFPEPDLSPIEPTPEGYIEYIEIIDSCGPHFEGGCVNARSGPNPGYMSVAKLRTGIVLRISELVIGEDGDEWYKVDFKEPLRYADRVTADWYVSAKYARLFSNEGPKELSAGHSTSKKIIVDLSEQTIYTYDGEELFMEQKVSTGRPATPTPRGTFKIYRKTPTRYMQGPIPGLNTTYYDLPGVPWNLYFTYEGDVFHGAYWHNSFGKVHSNGCVNLPIKKAEELYKWADLGTKVIVRD